MSEQLQDNTYTFGNSSTFEATRITMSGATGQDSSHAPASIISLERASIDRGNYLQALEDVNKSWQVLIDPKTGKQFEIALANLGVEFEEVDAELSTFTSSISGNIGNAVEFAEHSALHPYRKRLYIASFGNGKSSYWGKDEQQYIKQTGRFIQPDGQPLPTIAALNRALLMNELAITRASTNSAGGAYATALMGVLPEGQLTHAYIKSRPNISNHPSGLIWGLGMIASDMRDDGKYREASNDSWKLTDNLINEARGLLSDVYNPQASGQWSMQEATKTRGLQKLWSDMLAFSRGGAEFNQPAVLDTTRALQQQPEALLTYHFPLKDRLYNNVPDDIQEFINKVDYLGGVLTAGQVEALIMPGTHRDHTSYPSLRWSAESYTFSR